MKFADDIDDIPFLAVGNDELGGPLKEGDKVKCHNCKNMHPVVCGVDKNTKEKTNLIMFYHCGEDMFLAGLSGRRVRK